MSVLDEYTSTSGSWFWVFDGQGMNVTLSLDHRFYECFPCSASHMEGESPSHQNKYLFNNTRLGSVPSNERVTLWWQSHPGQEQS